MKPLLVDNFLSPRKKEYDGGMNGNTIPAWLQSSADPSQVSTTFTGLLRTASGLVVLMLVLKGVDPALATSQVGDFVANILTAAPALYAAWHSSEMLFGLIRKILIKTTGTKTVTPIPAPAQTGTPTA